MIMHRVRQKADPSSTGPSLGGLLHILLHRERVRPYGDGRKPCKHGDFIPGVRPREPTADYIDHLLSRITVIGAAYLTVVCVLPELLPRDARLPFDFTGGKLLIFVLATLELLEFTKTSFHVPPSVVTLTRLDPEDSAALYLHRDREATFARQDFLLRAPAPGLIYINNRTLSLAPLDPTTLSPSIGGG